MTVSALLPASLPNQPHRPPPPGLPQAIPLLKNSIKKAYGKKGDKIVNMNYAAVDKALERMVPIEIPQGWGQGKEVGCWGSGGETATLRRQRVSFEMDGWTGLARLLLRNRALPACPSPTPFPGGADPRPTPSSLLQLPVRLGAAEAAAAHAGTQSPSEFLDKVVRPMLALEGDRLPVRCGVGGTGRASGWAVGRLALREWCGWAFATVSTEKERSAHLLPVLPSCSVFTPGGFFPPGTTAIELRAIASKVPAWTSSSCTQCNICAFVCPHAAIRPVSLTSESHLCWWREQPPPASANPAMLWLFSRGRTRHKVGTTAYTICLLSSLPQHFWVLGPAWIQHPAPHPPPHHTCLHFDTHPPPPPTLPGPGQARGAGWRPLHLLHRPRPRRWLRPRRLPVPRAGLALRLHRLRAVRARLSRQRADLHPSGGLAGTGGCQLGLLQEPARQVGRGLVLWRAIVPG